MRPAPRGWPLRRTIALALLVKLLLLAALWQAFFAHPQTKKMRMPTASVEQHLLNTSTSPAKAHP